MVPAPRSGPPIRRLPRPREAAGCSKRKQPAPRPPRREVGASPGFSWQRLLCYPSTGDTFSLTLLRRAGNIPIGAEHAAVPWFGLEPFAAALADVKPGTGIFRHRLLAPKAAARTGKG